jgi:hypothetical protein
MRGCLSITSSLLTLSVFCDQSVEQKKKKISQATALGGINFNFIAINFGTLWNIAVKVQLEYQTGFCFIVLTQN